MSNTSNQCIRPIEEELLLKEMHMKNSITITPHKENFKTYGNSRKQSEPVRLTPAWEEKNLPSDVLNFKSVTMERAELEVNPATDRFLVVYFIILIHGIGTLMPWNMFINAKDYYETYKLHPNYTHVPETKFLANNYLTILGLVSQFPNVFFNWFNIFVNFGGNLTSRIVYAIVVEVVVFIFTEILVVIDTSSWPYTFFGLTMVSVFILNVANGIYQNTLYGLGSRLPPIYTGAIILGNNVSGIFTAVLNIVSKSIASGDTKQMAVYYFIIALFVLFVCFDTYFVLPFLKFYKYYDLQFKKAQEDSQQAAFDANKIEPQRTPYLKIFKGCFAQCFNVFYVFFITLSLFPFIFSGVKKTEPNFFIANDYYTDILCFVSFSLFAMLGNLLSTKVMWPGPKKLFIPVLLRTVFIPLLLFSNFQVSNHIDGVDVPKIRRFDPFFGDYAFGIFGILFAFTGGYFSSLAMMYCGKTVAPEHSSVAGMFGGACLVTGIFVGLMMPFAWPYIIFQ